MSSIKILIGMKFGKLTVIERNGSDKYKHAIWKCKCECGNYVYEKGYNLRWHRKSCGCGRKGINLGEKNGQWKGNKVGYNQLHKWVKDRFPKTKLCQCCKKKPPIDLSNKGIYNRELKNWEWLCRKCHMIKDGRINNLKQYNKVKK